MFIGEGLFKSVAIHEVDAGGRGGGRMVDAHAFACQCS
jgi:hypothetical protein